MQLLEIVNPGRSGHLRTGDILKPVDSISYAVFRGGVCVHAKYHSINLTGLSIQYTPVEVSDTAPPNPKAAFGDKKIPVFLVPLTFIYGVAVALFEGASKYGRWNWRKSPVEASTYVHATGRHLLKWYHGEDKDPVTRIHHLYNAAASLCILIDAEVAKTLIDDRPPKVDMTEQAQYLEDTIAHLKELFKDATPTHHKELN